MNTETKTAFTSIDLANFRAYEAVRSGGAWNMFDPAAQRATGLTRKEYIFVMENYSELEAAVATNLGQGEEL